MRVAAPPADGSVQMLPCRSMASVRPSGETPTDIEVPSETVTSIGEVDWKKPTARKKIRRRIPYLRSAHCMITARGIHGQSRAAPRLFHDLLHDSQLAGLGSRESSRR